MVNGGETVEVNADVTASSILVLQSSISEGKNDYVYRDARSPVNTATLVGQIVIFYIDGTMECYDLLYGYHTAEWNASLSGRFNITCYKAQAVPVGETKKGEKILPGYRYVTVYKDMYTVSVSYTHLTLPTN